MREKISCICYDVKRIKNGDGSAFIHSWSPQLTFRCYTLFSSGMEHKKSLTYLYLNMKAQKPGSNGLRQALGMGEMALVLIKCKCS